MLLLCQGRAEAILNYYIFEDGGNLKIETRGALTLTGLDSQTGSVCTPPPPGGFLQPSEALICSGVEAVDNPYRKYNLSGPKDFDYVDSGSGNYVGPANDTTGPRNWLWAKDSPTPYFYIIESYDNGPINSSATFTGKSLASVGIASTQLNPNIGSWTFFGDTNPTNVINVIVGAPPGLPVPAPLPLFGTAAAYGWSRRLRRRIGSASQR